MAQSEQNCEARLLTEQPEEDQQSTISEPSTTRWERLANTLQTSFLPVYNINLGPVLKQALALSACVAWMATSSALILVNKYLMTSDGFRYPMALSGLGMVFSSLLSWLVCRVFKWVETKRDVTLHFWLTKILPVGFFMALTLLTGNIVYLYLTVSFIQMLKAFTPIVTIVALFLAGVETPTLQLILAVAVIGVGTAMSSLGEININLYGMVFMIMSQAFEAIRLVMTQILLVGFKLHPIEGLMYLAPACTLWLMIGVSFLEWPAMARAGALSLVYQKPALYAAAGAMGFAVNALTYVVIQLSSSLTLKVLGTVKNALIVGIGVIFIGDLVTGLQGWGYAVSVAAFGWFNWIKLQQSKQASQVLPVKSPGGAAKSSGFGSGTSPQRPFKPLTGSAQEAGKGSCQPISKLDRQ